MKVYKLLFRPEITVLVPLRKDVIFIACGTGYSVIRFTYWSCVGIGIRVMLYFRILALPEWCLGCKSHDHIKSGDGS